MKKIFWGVFIVVAFIYSNPFTVLADDETLTPCAITSFKALPASVLSGGSSSLKWVTTGCMTNLVTQGSTSVISSPLPSGSVSTGPLSVTKTYTLTAVGDANSATAYATVTVGTPSVCSINSFIANPISIAYNTASVLSWTTQNCTNASISPTIATVPVNGSISTGNLTQTTIFTLTASNATNTATATKTITVIPPPQCTILLFNATPLTIAYAQTTTLNWKTVNCNTGLIDQGVGSITPTIIQGSVTTSPLTQTTVFKLTAVGTANTATAQITVNVAPAACTPNTWTQKADLGGSGRHEAIGFSIDNKGYIGTGYAYNGGTNKYYKDFWQYDQLANTWTQKADFAGTARMAAVGFKIGDKGYIGTGINTFTGPFDDIWEYNPTPNTWTQKASAGTIGWHQSVAFTINSKAYIGTGEDDLGKKKDFWAYDPTGNIWTQKADFAGTARSEAVGFTIGSKGYVGTGNTDNSTLKDFWEYDSTIDSWTQKADFAGTARKNAIAFSIGSRGYLGTGMSGSNNYKKDLWEYCPQI